MMTHERDKPPEQADPAAVFACALSLREACLRHAATDPQLNLSESYNGMDEFMRELMRVANLFETWACAHVAFAETNVVWPYLLEDRFGDACLASVVPSALAHFDDTDCLRVALRLRLPIQADDQLRVPVNVRALNPVAGSAFREFLIQTVRDDFDGGGVAPFTLDDDPFDEAFGSPYFGLYGVEEDGVVEHIGNRESYSAALSLAQKLVPGLAFPIKPICFVA